MTLQVLGSLNVVVANHTGRQGTLACVIPSASARLGAAGQGR